MSDLRWHCPICLRDLDEPWCEQDSLHLTELVHPDTFSRRVPGVRTPAELERVRRIYGAQAAAQVAMNDAIAAVLRKPDEQKLVDGLWEADHFDMQRNIK